MLWDQPLLSLIGGVLFSEVKNTYRKSPFGDYKTNLTYYVVSLRSVLYRRFHCIFGEVLNEGK